MVFEHSFVTGTARNVEFLNSPCFQTFIDHMLNLYLDNTSHQDVAFNESGSKF
jgi:hypothetical protein